MNFMKTLLLAALLILGSAACVPSAQAQSFVSITDHTLAVPSGNYSAGVSINVTGYWSGGSNPNSPGNWTHEDWYSPNNPYGLTGYSFKLEPVTGVTYSNFTVSGDQLDSTWHYFPQATTLFILNDGKANGQYTVKMKATLGDQNESPQTSGVVTIVISKCDFPYTGCSDQY